MPGESRQITLQLTGAGLDDRFVALDDFASLCESLRRILRGIEADVAGVDAAVHYRIVDLRCGSASVTVEASRSDDARDLGAEVVGLFRGTMRALQSDSPVVDERLSHRTIKRFGELFKPLKRSADQGGTRLLCDGLTLDKASAGAVARLLAATARSHGSVTGRLERLNVHAGKREFWLWPALHGARIPCTFPEALLPLVREAVQRTVTVWGILHYRLDRPYPERASVRELEIHPRELATLSEMRGIARLSQGRESVAAVRTLRDDDE